MYSDATASHCTEVEQALTTEVSNMKSKKKYNNKEDVWKCSMLAAALDLMVGFPILN